MKLNFNGIITPCYFIRTLTWCQSKATHVENSLPHSRFLLVKLVNLDSSLIIYYLLLHHR